MQLFRLSQTVVRGYDTFDSCVVVAKDMFEAITIHPFGDGRNIADCNGGMWPTTTDNISVEYLGEAHPRYTKPAVICASFNAG